MYASVSSDYKLHIFRLRSKYLFLLKMQPQMCLYTVLLFTSLLTEVSSLTENEILSISTSIPNVLIALLTIIVLCVVIFCLAKLMCLRKELLLRQLQDLELQRGTVQQTEPPEDAPVETENPPSYHIAIEMYENSSSNSEAV